MNDATLQAKMGRGTVRLAASRAWAFLREMPHLLLGPVLFLLAWEWATRQGYLSPRFIAPPSAIVRELFTLVFVSAPPAVTGMSTLTFWEHIGGTLYRTLVSYVVAACLAVPLGMLIGWSRPAEAYLRPLFSFFRPLPGVSLLPLTILFFGRGNSAQMPVIVYASFFAILINTTSGVRNIAPSYVKVARVMEIRGMDLFRKVILPASLPHIFTGLRLSIVDAITSCAGTEILAGTQGVGYLIYNSQRSFHIPTMYASVIALAVLGFALNFAIEALRDHILRYQPAA